MPTLSGAGRVVAVIDTGVDYSHPAIGEGFGPGFTVVGGWDFVDNDPDPRDTSPNGHGTAVTGVIAAEQFISGPFLYSGIAPGVQVVALRIAEDVESVPLSRLEAALKWVVDHSSEFNFDAVNISFGFGRFTEPYIDEVIGDELNQLSDLNIVVVASSGNDSTAEGPGIDYPGAHPHVISVGAVDSGDVITEFSQRAAIMEILAPGSDVVTLGIGGTFARVTGTSFAAPMVTGTVALLKQIDPTLTPASIRSILRASASINLDGDSEFGMTTGIRYPRLDVFRAASLANLRLPAAPEVAPPIGRRGDANAIEADRYGTSHFLYFDVSSRSMRYATRAHSGAWSSTSFINNSIPDQGQFLSLELDAFGRPHVAYFDGHQGDLVYALHDGEAWRITPVDTRGSVGLYPSISLDALDQPSIAYYRRTSGDLRLAELNSGSSLGNVDGSGVWSIRDIDRNDDVGRWSSMARSGDGRLGIVYENTSTGVVKFAQQDGLRQWSNSVIDATTRGVAFTSVVFDPNGDPHIAYYDANPADLRYSTKRFNVWQNATLATRGATGLYTNVLIDSQGQAEIFYYDRRTDSTRRATYNGAIWSNVEVATGRGRYLTAARLTPAFGQSPVGVTLVSFRSSNTRLVFDLV